MKKYDCRIVLMYNLNLTFFRKYDKSTFMKMMSHAKRGKDYSSVQEFYIATFSSPVSKIN